MRTPLSFTGPPAALNVPALWALQDMSSASVRPPRTTSVVDPAACSLGKAPSPLSPDAGQRNLKQSTQMRKYSRA